MTLPVYTPFKRGATFSCQLLIPESVASGFFVGWLVKAQLRRKSDDSREGLIANLNPSWTDQTTSTLVLSALVTDSWPVGPAELDVLFVSPDGAQKIRSQTLLFDIQRGITQ